MQIYAVSITIRIVVSHKHFLVLCNFIKCSLAHSSTLVFNYTLPFLVVRFYEFSRFAISMTVAATLFLQLGFTLLTLIWEFDFPPFMVLIIAILNDGKFFLMQTGCLVKFLKYWY